MVSPPTNPLGKATDSAIEADDGSRPIGAPPATVLLLAVGIGLAAGFLDLGLMVVKKRAIDRDFYRLGGDFWWIIPLGVAALLLLPGVSLALAARRRRRGIRLELATGLLGFVGFLDLGARLPLDFWASALLSGGLAVQSARLVRGRRQAYLRLVRRATPLLIGALLVVALVARGGSAWSDARAARGLPPPPPAAANVLIIVWDTVRAGSLRLHGYGRPTTPHLERLAARGVRFDEAFATSSWTLPSHAGLFTGRWPHELSAGWRTPLDGAYPTLAGYLRSLGYDTAGFVANLDYCGRETGLARGFAHYEDYPIGAWEVFTRYVGLGRRIDLFSLAFVVDKLAGGRGRGPSPVLPISKEHAKRGAEVDQAFLDWLSWQRPRGRPFFAFLNYVDAHSPYEVPDPSAEGYGHRPSSWRDLSVLQRWLTLDKTRLPYRDVQMAIDVYDECITYLVRRLGALLDELGRRGVLDDTLVLVTSDHGEHLGDHVLFFHGCSLYRQLVEVPLVIVGPKAVPAGRVVAEPVSLRDVPATVVDLLGLDRGSPFPGRSLARCWGPGDARDRLAAEPLLMEAGMPPLLVNQGREPAAKGPMQAVVAGGMHYIHSGDGLEELFSLKSDPDERMNLAGLPEARGALQGFRRTLGSMLRAAPRK
jgi:arylsulfatase A-like enzyme